MGVVKHLRKRTHIFLPTSNSAPPPPSSKIVSTPLKVTITSSRYKMDVSYTAEIVPTYTDGSCGIPFVYNGVYEGVQVHDVTVTFEQDVPLD